MSEDLRKLRDEFVDAMARECDGASTRLGAETYRTARTLLAALDREKEANGPVCNAHGRNGGTVDPECQCNCPVAEPLTYKDSSGCVFCSTCNTALDLEPPDEPGPPKAEERTADDAAYYIERHGYVSEAALIRGLLVERRELRAERDEYKRRIEAAQARIGELGTGKYGIGSVARILRGDK